MPLSKTAKPFTYCIDYGGMDGHLPAADKLLERVSAAPPHLLHIGHDVPCPNTYGPIMLSGKDGPRRLTPAQTRTRTEEIRRFLRRLRDAGCKTIIPYICNQTLAGHPDKRLGIWDFYDHWDDYADLGVGPRPEADPMQWLARERNGRPHFNYEMRHEAFEPHDMTRWAPCCNNPHYHMWQRMVVRQIARVGYDGVFVDNCILNCYCEYCQGKFRDYLTKRYTPARLAEAFGTDDVTALSLAHVGSRLEWVKEAPTFKDFLYEHFTDEALVRWLGTADLDKARIEEGGNGWLWGRAHDYRLWLERQYSPEQLERLIGVPDLSQWGLTTPAERLLWAETKRFWAQSVCDNLQMIKQTGQAERDGFLVTPNWGNMEEPDAAEFREEIGQIVALWAPAMDFMMFEEGNAPGCVAPGLYLDHILQHKLALGLGVRPAVLPYGRMHEGAVEVCNAQNVAFGGLAYIQPGTGFPDARAKWSAFLAQHGHRLEGAEPLAGVAVVCLFDELILENHRHQTWVQRLIRYLADQHVLFDLATERQLCPEGLAPYRALIVPAARYLSDAQVSSVLDFARSGGTVVLMGESGTHDELTRPRSTPGFAPLLETARSVATGLLVSEDGRCIAADTPDPLIGPYRLSREDALQFATYSQSSINVPSGSAGLVFELDRMVGLDRYLDPCELAPRLEAATGRQLRLADPRAAMGVRFNASQCREADRVTVLLHAVNYNVPLLPHPRGKTVEPVENLVITLPAEPEWEDVCVTTLVPGYDEVSLPARLESGTVQFTIPRLRVYKLVVLEARL